MAAKKILCVIRVSTDRQEMESQKLEMLDFCKSKGFRENSIEWLEAQGASARKLNKKYRQMIDDIKNYCTSGGIKNVALWHLNRLGRVDSVLTDMKNFFIETQTQVYVKEPTLTLLNEDGSVNSGTEIAWSIFATMIKQDTSELIAKLNRGREQNRKEGKWNGGANGALYGYCVDENGYIVPEPHEVKLINDLFRDYASGKYSIRALAKEYRDRGITQRDGKKITDMWLAKLVKNETYIGKNELRKYRPIVPIDLWEKVERIRKENDLKIRTKESKNVNLAVKILKCKECGHNYVATRDKYTCYKRVMAHRFADGCNNSVSVSIRIMDGVVWYVARQLHIDYMQSTDNKTIAQNEKKILIATEKRKESEKKINELTERYERVQDLYMNGDINKDRYNKQTAKIKADRAEYENQIRTYTQDIMRLRKQNEDLKNPSLDARVYMSLNILDIEDRKQQKEIVNQHIKECYVERSEVGNRKCIIIYVKTFTDITRKFVYFYTIKDDKKQLFEITNKELFEVGTLIFQPTRRQLEEMFGY